MEPSSREIGAPLAGWLLVVAGGLTVLNNHLPGAETLDRGVLNLLGGLAVLLGTTSFMLPWRPRGAGGRRTGQARHRHRWRRGRRRRTCPAAGVPAARGGRKDGSVLWATAKASQLEGPGQRSGGTLATVADATARKATEDELRRPALVDELTGLRNRRGFLAVAEHLAQVAQRTGKNMALVYIDLDNMKEINDRFGHSAGDRALVETAEILRSTFRKSDVLGRFGGDEFCVLMRPGRCRRRVRPRATDGQPRRPGPGRFPAIVAQPGRGHLRR